jgi:hypothetical protein
MIVLNKRVQAILGDLIVFYYAFFKWGAVKENRNQITFTYHKKSQYLFIFLALIHEQILECIAFHYLLTDKFSHSFVLLLQIIHVYVIIYLIGDYNLVRRGRIHIVGDKLLIHIGIRASLEIEINEIESIRTIEKESELVKSSRTFWVVGTPLFYNKMIGFKDKINCQITLKNQVKAYGFLGISRRVKQINLSLDQCSEFVSTIKGFAEN